VISSVARVRHLTRRPLRSAWTETTVLLYFIIAAIGILFLIVSLVVGEVLDVFDFEWDDGVHPLSTKVVAVGLTAFGATGMITRYYEWSALLSALTSALAALLLGALMWWMLSALYRGSASTDVSISALVGRRAQVTVGIPAASVGEILIAAADSTRHILARSRDGQPIPVGSSVRIVESLGNVVLVERTETTANVPETSDTQQAV
jgi:membrane protein implicated in regulation of membrane protease activity